MYPLNRERDRCCAAKRQNFVGRAFSRNSNGAAERNDDVDFLFVVERNCLATQNPEQELAGTESHSRANNDARENFIQATPSENDTEANSLIMRSNLLQSSLLSQIRAQLLKKFICTKRSWIEFLWAKFIKPIVIMLLFVFGIQLKQNNSLPPLKMALEFYEQSFSVLEEHNSTVLIEYQRLFRGTNGLETINGHMEEFILQKFNHSILEYNSELLVGASFSDDSYTGWFNAKILHSAPLALNLISNAILHTVCPSCSITVVNHPLPRQNEDKNNSTDSNDDLDIIFAILFIMTFVTSSYVTFYIRERTNRVKLLQVVSGLHTGVYWLVNVLWDLLTFTLSCMVILIMIFGYQVEVWSDLQPLFTLQFIFFVFALATLPIIYLFSFMISNPASGYSRVMLIIGIGAITLSLVSEAFSYFEFYILEDLVDYISMIIPIISLDIVLDNFSTYTSIEQNCEYVREFIPNCTMEQLCSISSNCCTAYSDLFSFTSNGMLQPSSFMIATGALFFFLIWCTERKIFHRLWAAIRPCKNYHYTVPQPHMDSDVLLEKSRISRMTDTDIATHRLVLRNLTKNFGPISAVKWLSLGTQPSECFGLLGVNGAGKTTAFRMMIGDETISFGDVWINGVNVKSSLAQAYQHVGYCPQFDGLLDELTGLETLRIFAMLRGIPCGEIHSEVQSLVKELGLTKHLNKLVREYSGGTKRKLSTALALIGSPSVIFLDEPTSGLDLGAKRQVWNVINRMRDAGRTIILTTHSMDECEALCTRLAIMVSGEFKCLGSTQHLKNKFSGGFLLHIKMVQVPGQNEMLIQAAAVKAFVAERFRDAVLKEDLQNSLRYHIPRSELTWSAMFGIMEASKELLGIEEYSLGQTTLEQVFLAFANDCV